MSFVVQSFLLGSVKNFDFCTHETDAPLIPITASKQVASWLF